MGLLAWIYVHLITLGTIVNGMQFNTSGNPKTGVFASQQLSVGLLMTGKTMSSELYQSYGSASSRISDWLSSGMSDVCSADDPIALLNMNINGVPSITPVRMEFEFTEYDVAEFQFPEHPEKHDLYVISGSNHGVNDDLPWSSAFSEFIRSVDTIATSGTHLKPVAPKVIGICFGHQMIHASLGGEVVSAYRDTPGIGTHTYDIYKHHAIMRASDPFMPKFHEASLVLDVLHNDQVVTPAEGFEVLAGNAFCPVGMTVKDDHILTFQPHPEYPNRENRYVTSLLNFALDANWVNEEQHLMMGKNIESAPFPESARVLAWTVNFLADSRRPTHFESDNGTKQLVIPSPMIKAGEKTGLSTILNEAQKQVYRSLNSALARVQIGIKTGL